jgi:ankyrin repeat protein
MLETCFIGTNYLCNTISKYFFSLGVSQTFPLSAAAKEGHLSMVKFLIGKKAMLSEKILFKTSRFQIIKYLLQKEANPKATDDNGNTLLHKECERGNLKNVKYLIEHYDADVSAKNKKGQTPLHLACTKEFNLKVVKFLIEEQKADYEIACKNGKTALHYAAQHLLSVGVVSYLIKNVNADPAVTCSEGKTALHYATKNGGLGIARFLIEKANQTFEATDNEGKTIFHLVCIHESFDIVKYLIEEKSQNFEVPDKGGKTAVHYILQNCKSEKKYTVKLQKRFQCLALLIKAKAKIMDSTDRKYTDNILDWVRQSYDMGLQKEKEKKNPIIGCLITGLQSFQKQFDTKNVKKIHYNLLLHIAHVCNRLDIAEFIFNQDFCYLKKHEISEDKKLKEKLLLNSYIQFSCEVGFLDLTKFLFQEAIKGPDYFQDLKETSVSNNRNGESKSKLFKAGFLKSIGSTTCIDVFQYLLEEEKAKNEANAFLKGFPLHYVCRMGTLEMAKYLIERKLIASDAKDKNGRTPLHLACSSGSLVIVKYLIEEQNANTETTDKISRNLLHFACLSDSLEVVKYISKKSKADVNAQQKNGSTALHVACEQKNVDIVKYLVSDMKADCNIVNKQRRTPLHIACKVQCYQISKFLVNRGTNVLAKDKYGNKIPLQWAKRLDTKLVTFMKATTKR